MNHLFGARDEQEDILDLAFFLALMLCVSIVANVLLAVKVRDYKVMEARSGQGETK